MAAKNVKKKKSRRLKRQVRKTLGALFLASAVVVAAIPTNSYGGGSTQAAVTTNSDGTSSYTHIVGDDWKDGSDTSSHSEDYPIVTTATAKSVFVNTSNVTVSSPNIGASSSIPICNTDTTIYSTGDGDFQFAYVPETGNENDGGNKFAVILGYSHQGSLTDGTLEIPDTMDAYLNYNDNTGSGTGFVAVGKSANYLFYVTDSATNYYTYSEKEETVTQTKTDANGNTLYNVYDQSNAKTYTDVTQSAIDEMRNDGTLSSAYTQTISTETVTNTITEYIYYSPCYYSSISEWEGETLYYYPTDTYRPDGTALSTATYDDYSNIIPVAATTQAYERIKNAAVIYIGNQYLKATTSGWEIDTSDNSDGIITSSEDGIFAGNGNIGTLIVGDNLSGIGDYAFYRCTALKSITLANGLDTIGNHAFDGCNNMTTINLPDECKITTLGAYAFKNCQALTSFTVPVSVVRIGDGAFKGCWSLESINLSGNGNGSLTYMGSYVFQNCSSLTSLTFPKSYSETVELSMFEGCSSLEWIRSENTLFNIVESTTCDYGWDAFKLDGDNKNKFYIEGPSSSSVHTTCTDNEVAFKYLDQTLYELTKKENGTDDPTVTYQVDSTYTLTDAKFNGYVTSLTFPDYIGPYYIKNIGDEAFRDHCSLTEITIASTIESIGAKAFQGCHNLEYVYFNTDTVTIGSYAFQTQEVLSHSSSCTNYGSMTEADNTPAVTLHFVGTVGSSSTAYNYAMSYSGRYSTGSQALSFIEYLSGWPTCLTVKYNYDSSTATGYSELVDFPTQSDLSDYADKEYLSDEEKTAAAYAIANMNNSGVSLTEDQETFINAAKSLTIPAGVDAIEDGLFYNKTNDAGDATEFPVYCYGLTAIEAGYTDDVDDDGFPVVDPETSDFAGCPNLSAFYIYGDTESIAEGAFTDNTGLVTFYIGGGTTTIGDHAFRDCESLTNVSLSGSITDIGIRPFAGCSSLSSVDFQDNTGFICDNSIIYATTTDGVKTKIIELLEGRTSRVTSGNDDITTVTAMKKEAFQGTNVSYIDLSDTAITSISERAFADTHSLTFVDLPSASTASTVQIQNDAFRGSVVKEISGEQNVNLIASRGTDGIYVDYAGDSTKLTSNTDTQYNEKVTIYAPEDSYLYQYAVMYDFTVETVVPTYYYTVTFRDWDETLGQNVTVDTQTVARGESATAPTPAGKTGYVFDCWDTDYSEIYSDTVVTAVYSTPPEGYGQYLVTYMDYDNDMTECNVVYATEYVDAGGDAQMNFKEPTKSGYT
ncbi:MAG: leucine-rich repeat domain-containing protein, partial [Lachnospiraceae bacterium]|nr:leucine-rich repeat domain-containing protein [Lachnospiraceae bacterium]